MSHPYRNSWLLISGSLTLLVPIGAILGGSTGKLLIAIGLGLGSTALWYALRNWGIRYPGTKYHLLGTWFVAGAVLAGYLKAQSMLQSGLYLAAFLMYLVGSIIIRTSYKAGGPGEGA